MDTIRIRNDKQNKIFTWAKGNSVGMNYIIIDKFTLSYDRNRWLKITKKLFIIIVVVVVIVVCYNYCDYYYWKFIVKKLFVSNN